MDRALEFTRHLAKVMQMWCMRGLPGYLPTEPASSLGGVLNGHLSKSERESICRCIVGQSQHRQKVVMSICSTFCLNYRIAANAHASCIFQLQVRYEIHNAVFCIQNTLDVTWRAQRLSKPLQSSTLGTTTSTCTH